LGALASLFGASFSFFSVVYTVLLGGAVAAAATWRRWPQVLVAAVFASYLNFVILHAQEVDPTQIVVGTLGLLLVFSIAPLTGRSLDPGPHPFLWGMITAGSWILAWGLALLALDRGIGLGIDTWDGPITGAIALGALLLAWFARANFEARWGWGVAFAAASIVWPGLQFEAQWQAFGWAGLIAIGGAVLAWRDRPVARGYIALLGAILVGRLYSVELFRLMDDSLAPLEGAPSFALGAVALLGSWFVAGRAGTRSEPLARSLLGLGLAIPLGYALGVLDGFAVPIAWTLEAVVLVVAGFMFGQRDLRLAALILFGLVLARIFLVDLLALDLAVRIITFLAVGGLLLVASFLFARRQRTDRQPPAAAPQQGRPR
jgi:hypothetical protein